MFRAEGFEFVVFRVTFAWEFFKGIQNPKPQALQPSGFPRPTPSWVAQAIEGTAAEADDLCVGFKAPLEGWVSVFFPEAG